MPKPLPRATASAVTAAGRRHKSPAALVFARFARDRSAMLGAWIALALVGFALLAPLVLPDPNLSDFSLDRDPGGAPPGPSWRHPLGTDPLFRDLLARLAVGARSSLFIGLGATAIALSLGTLVGLVAGSCEGERVRLFRSRFSLPVSAIDFALMRVCDVALAFPFLLLVTAVGAAVGRTSAGGVLLILGLTSFTGVARLVRAKTMQLKREGYVLAARALGAGRVRVALRHVLPGLWGNLLVIGSQAVGGMILAEAVLGYLMLGLEPPTPSWGRMLHEAEGYLGLRSALVAVPGFAIMLAVLGFNRLGEGLDEALAPHKSTRERRARPVDLYLALGLLLVVGLLGPGAPAAPRGAAAPAAAAPRPGGVLRLATSQGVRSIDPALAYDELSSSIAALVFARLVRYDARGAIVGDLASSFEVLDDGRRYRFTLRPGLTFHDGAPLGARDVKRSLERALGPKTPGPASLYAPIAGFAPFRRGAAAALAGVRVVDDRRVDIELDAPNATFLPLMTLGFAAPVCPSSPPADPKKPASPCGAGPFRVATWERGVQITLARFEGYHEPGRPYLDGVTWYTEMPAPTQRYRFETGELDLLRELGSADIARYAADGRWGALARRASELATNGVFLNTEVPPFDREAVRQAVAAALDPSVLVKLRPTIEVADRMAPPALAAAAGRTPEPLRVHDVERALALMRAAGLAYDPATGRGGWPDVIDYAVVPDSLEQGVAEVVQQQLAGIGLRVRLRAQSYPTYLVEVSRRRTSAMGWTGWHADFPDWTNFFAPTLTSSAIDDARSTNVAFFSDAELDEVVARGEREIDPGARAALYERAEAIVHERAPWIPLWRSASVVFVQPYVMDYEPHGLAPNDFAAVWLAPSATGVQRALAPAASGGAP